MTATLNGHDELAEQYLPLAKSLARRLWSKHPDRDLDAMESDACLGLLQASRSYSPSMGRFATWAHQRILGAMVDGIRERADMKRQDYKRWQTIEAARYKFAAVHHRFPTYRELAEALGVTPRELTESLIRINKAPFIHVDSAGGEESEPWWNNIPSPQKDDLPGGLDRDSFIRMISRLPCKERVVLGLYYWEGLTLAEIGGVLGVTESRISQLHQRALNRLRRVVSKEVVYD